MKLKSPEDPVDIQRQGSVTCMLGGSSLIQLRWGITLQSWLNAPSCAELLCHLLYLSFIMSLC